jgi:hypothetical protein
MSGPSEWEGEPHTLIVRSVRPPDGPLDSGDLTDYEIQHAPGCKQEQHGEGDHAYMDWACDVAWYQREGDMAFCLSYSGTPVTEPGTYQIQDWGRKYYVHDYGAYEYDGGVGVVPAGGEGQ